MKLIFSGSVGINHTPDVSGANHDTQVVFSPLQCLLQTLRRSLINSVMENRACTYTVSHAGEVKAHCLLPRKLFIFLSLDEDRPVFSSQLFRGDMNSRRFLQEFLFRALRRHVIAALPMAIVPRETGQGRTCGVDKGVGRCGVNVLKGGGLTLRLPGLHKPLRRPALCSDTARVDHRWGIGGPGARTPRIHPRLRRRLPLRRRRHLSFWVPLTGREALTSSFHFSFQLNTSQPLFPWGFLWRNQALRQTHQLPSRQ